MECSGHKWRLPRKTDEKGWKSLVGLIQWKRERGLSADRSPTDSDCGHGGPYVPSSKVSASDAYRRSTYERDRLARARARRKVPRDSA